MIEKKNLIAQLRELEPIAYIDHDGKEHTLLAAPKVIQNVVASQEKDQSPSFFIVPKKRKMSVENDPCEVSYLQSAISFWIGTLVIYFPSQIMLNLIARLHCG